MSNNAAPATQSVLRELASVARESTFDVVGNDACTSVPTARVAVALLRGFRGEHGLLYFEAHPASGGSRPPDLLLCTESIGVLSIEIKAHAIDAIEKAQNGALYVRYRGRIKPRSVIQQARDAMFEMKDAIASKVEQTREPFIDFLVLLPEVSRSDWVARGLDRAFPDDEILLGDNLRDPAALRRRLVERAKQRNRRRGIPLLQSGMIPAIRAAFGDTAVLRDNRSLRDLREELSLGALVDEMACAEKNLSAEQQDLSRKGQDGSPRVIRGVAGSGKTVVLANIVARTLWEDIKRDEESLFPCDRPRRIAAVCFNRCLVPFIEKKISDAFGSFSGRRLPQACRPRVTHFNGLMWQLSKSSGGPLEYVPMKTNDGVECTAAERASSYRTQVEAVRPSGDLDPWLFDTVLVDEAQDLEPDELRVLVELCRSDPRSGGRNVIVFYDDAQNVYGRARPVWSDLGINARGRTSVMKTCFRNTRQVVEFAFNVLLGTGATPDERVKTRGFADIAYLGELGLVSEEDDLIAVRFTERDDGELPEVHAFPTREAETDWIIGEISDLVTREQVRAEDILIVAESMTPFARLIDHAGQIPGIAGIVQPHLGDDKDRFIFRERCLTATTTKSAKGYDAWVVFVAGADRFSLDNPGRASFYVGCTRGKYRLYVSGVRDERRSLLDECFDIHARMVARDPASERR